jgi:K+-sensing histidine kinase KdpD
VLIDCCAAVALLIAHWPAMHLGFAPVSLLLCAVMLSAWVGGVGPGLVATILSAAVFYYGFCLPFFPLWPSLGRHHGLWFLLRPPYLLVH